MPVPTSNRAAWAALLSLPLWLALFLYSSHQIVSSHHARYQESLGVARSAYHRSLDSLRRQLSLTAYVLRERDTITACGTAVPLHEPYVRSQVQRELNFFLDRRGALIEAWQNLGRYERIIQEYFARDSLHPDLWYLFVAENFLRRRGLSSRGAEGPCQITEPTGRYYKLRIDRFVDERRAPRKAFDVASRHLAASWSTFRNWLLAVAAYNRGDGGMNEHLQVQGFESFFDVLLPNETQRYGYQFLALAHIFRNPDSFVPGIGEVPREPPFEVTAERVVLKRETSLAQLAQLYNLTPATFWDLNQQFRGARLPPGTYTVYLPPAWRSRNRDAPPP